MSFFTNVVSAVRNRFLTLFAPSVQPAAEAWYKGGGEEQHDFWLYAVPVNMMLGRDSFFLSEPAPLTLSDDESLAIVASLNEHFSEDGYHFYLQSAVWFLGIDHDPSIATSHIDQVVSKDIEPYLPTGEGALAWASLQNEIQMLLFNHPVNTAREVRGEMIVNSLWCYGESAA